MSGGGKRAAGGTTRLLVEKGPAPAASEEERDNVERRESRLAELIERLGGKGRAKVYRIVDGVADPQYACTWQVDGDLADNLEERLAELGGGKYAVKLYWGAKCEASLTFSVDALSHPVKKTEAEQRREGGVMPQSPAELAAFVSQSVAAVLQPLVMSLQQPRNDGMGDMLKLMLLSAQQQAAESRAMTDRLLDGMFQQRTAAAPANQGLRELAETVGLVDSIRGEGGGRDPRDEKRGLATRLLEGPVEKAAIRMADRVIDKFYADEQQPQQQQRRRAPVAGTPPAAAAAAPPPPAAAAPERPAQLPPTTPTTPVTLPRGVKPLSGADLARAHGSPKQTPAPRAADAVPAAVAPKG